MKVNFLTGNLILRKNKTGVHLYFENLINEFIKNNRNDEIKISVYGRKKSFEEKFSHVLCYPMLIFSHKLTRVLAYFFPIEWFFFRNDVYICDGLMPITFYKSFKIAVVHDQMVKIYPENYSFIMKAYLNYFYYRMMQKADVVIAVSETTKKDVIKYWGIDEKKIKIVYNGIDFDYIKNMQSIKLDIRFDITVKYLFYVGDLRKNKNVISAIKGFELYLKTGADMYFYIAGNQHHEYNFLVDYVKENHLEKKVVFLGYITEPEKYMLYKHAYAFLFVSLYEGFGVPILEAMASKTPVITSNCSSMKEIAEQASLQVNPLDIADIADKISLLNDAAIRNKCIKNGMDLVEKYTWNNSYIQFQSIIDELKVKKNAY
jgi:glycosyltransferase involved in cell wall biosynthesis